MTRVRRLTLLLAVATMALAASCKGVRGTTDIKVLLDDPAQYDGKTVRIAGSVTKSIGALGYGAYELDDGTGTLPVVSEHGGAPREGAKVGVEGTFRNAFTLGTKSVNAVLEKKRYTVEETK